MKACYMNTIACLLLAAFAAPLRAEKTGEVQIALLGDSTTAGAIPRLVAKNGPHLEDVIRMLIAAEKDLPPCNVINCGIDGGFIDGFLTRGEYERAAAKLSGLDYVFIRYGINDIVFRKDFDANFPKDYRALIARLRKDFPAATIIPMTVIPNLDPGRSERINAIVRRVAAEEGLPLLDIYPRYAKELERGPNMLTYRRYSLNKIPAKYHEFVKPFLCQGQVVVLDNCLDAHFADLPGWFGDRHPNLAGYHIIGDEIAKFLVPLIRLRMAKEKLD